MEVPIKLFSATFNFKEQANLFIKFKQLYFNARTLTGISSVLISQQPICETSLKFSLFYFSR